MWTNGRGWWSLLQPYATPPACCSADCCQSWITACLLMTLQLITGQKGVLTIRKQRDDWFIKEIVLPTRFATERKTKRCQGDGLCLFGFCQVFDGYFPSSWYTSLLSSSFCGTLLGHHPTPDNPEEPEPSVYALVSVVNKLLLRTSMVLRFSSSAEEQECCYCV